MQICFVALADAMVSTIAGPIDVLRTASLLSTAYGAQFGKIKTDIVAEEEGLVRCYNGLMVNSTCSFNDIKKVDMVVLPSLGLENEGSLDQYPELIRWLKQVHRNGAILCSICTGAFLLAETGLLNNKMATTHWAFAELFRQRYPDVDLHPDRSLIDSGDVITAGAGTAWHDFVIRTVEKKYNEKVALQAAKMFLLQNHITGQTPYQSAREAKTSDAIIKSAIKWFNEHLAEEDLINRCADHVGLSTRNFKRRFKVETDFSPLNYIQKVRVENAKEALELTTQSIEHIALSVGYNDVSFFRRVFKRETAMTPLDYRKKFKLSLHNSA